MQNPTLMIGEIYVTKRKANEENKIHKLHRHVQLFFAFETKKLAKPTETHEGQRDIKQIFTTY